MIASIVIEPTGVRGERGCRYRVLYGGEIMIWDTLEPRIRRRSRTA